MLFDCPHCRNKIRIVRDQKSGGSVKCPKCGNDSASWETDTATLRVIPKTIGKYELRIRLGQGQFGEVWSAHDPDLDRLIAIKIPRNEDLDAFDVERFFREARAAAQLQHHNIVKLLEFGEDPIYIASELIDGASLADRLATGWRPTWQETATLCMKLAQALQHAHERGVVHRDIKPANVLTDKAMEPFLSDFGLAKRDGGEITMTFDGQIIGTPAYMPPEQARGDGHNADARSDVYSLGVVLFEMLTGIRPFQGGTQVLIQQILYQDARPLRTINRSIPKDLETICLKCLEKAPQQRYQTAQLLADELQRVLNGELIYARPISRIARWGRWANRNRRMAALLATCLLLFVSLGIVVFDNWRGDRPVTVPVTINTYPPAATLTFYRIDPSTGQPIPPPITANADEQLHLESGEYLIHAELPGYGTHEVMRHVPKPEEPIPASSYFHHFWRRNATGEVMLPPIVIIADKAWRPDTIEVEAGQIRMKPPKSEEIDETLKFELLKTFPARQTDPTIQVSPFALATHELTRGEAVRIITSRCIFLPEILANWQTPEGCQQCLKELELDPTDSNAANEPITNLSFDEAMYLAEYGGMRLMTEEEYLYVATNRDTTTFPWGEDASRIKGWPNMTQDYDVTSEPAGIRGLFSGPAEWTSSWPLPLPGQPSLPRMPVQLYRVVRGHLAESNSPVSDGPFERPVWEKTTQSRFIGVRLARTLRNPK